MGDREQAKAAARKEREAAEAEAARKASARRRMQLTGAGVGVVAIVAVVLAVVLGSGGDASTPESAEVKLPPVQETDLAAAATAAGGRFTEYRRSYGMSKHTTDPVKYPMNPPTNGPHHPQWASDADYSGRATPQTEMLVHALEHGRIEIQYSPELPQAEVDQLRALYAEAPAHVLLFENATGMDAAVAATAWGHGLLFDRFTPQVFDAIRAFRETYRDKGPELVP